MNQDRISEFAFFSLCFFFRGTFQESFCVDLVGRVSMGTSNKRSVVVLVVTSLPYHRILSSWHSSCQWSRPVASWGWPLASLRSRALEHLCAKLLERMNRRRLAGKRSQRWPTSVRRCRRWTLVWRLSRKDIAWWDRTRPNALLALWIDRRWFVWLDDYNLHLGMASNRRRECTRERPDSSSRPRVQSMGNRWQFLAMRRADCRRMCKVSYWDSSCCSTQSRPTMKTKHSHYSTNKLKRLNRRSWCPLNLPWYHRCYQWECFQV